jgi:formylglycine-generating enzyme required for sulfatase activity
VADPIEDPTAARYAPASEVNPKGQASGAFRVVRGGSYLDAAHGLRSAARWFRLATDRDKTIGFRCVHSAGAPL